MPSQKSVDHACNLCPYTCEGCTRTRAKYKRKKRKGTRAARIVDDTLMPKKALVRGPHGVEGRGYANHEAVERLTHQGKDARQRME